MSQMDQHETDPAEIDRNPGCTETALQQSPLNKGSPSSEHQQASTFLPQQTRYGRTQLVNRNCKRDT